MKPSEIAFGIIRIPIDFLMVLAAFILAYHIRTFTDLIPGVQLPLDLSSFPPIEIYQLFSIKAALGFLALAAFSKMYSLRTTVKINNELKQIIMVTSAWLMVLIAYFFLIRSFPFSRLALIYTWFLSILFIAFGRLLIRLIVYHILKSGVGKKKLLFIGDNKITHSLLMELKKDISYSIIGYLDDKKTSDSSLPYIGTLNDLAEVVRKYKIEEIMQTKPDLNKMELENLLTFCRENHLGFSFVPSLLEVQQANIETETISNIPVIKLKPTPLDGWGKVLKRTFDIIGATIGLIILSPVFLITAILIKIDSKGTIFFKFLDNGDRVKRVGTQGALFNFYKFRTMHPNTHNLRYTQLAEQNLRKGTPMVKIQNDPRVTKVGKVLRKTSIDEIPQLFNVLKGNMSLVGPRPHLPEEVAKYQKHQKFVLTIKPGITGMGQVSGRSNLDFEEEIQLDSFYIEHWSLWLDIVILFKTFAVLFQDYKE